MTHELHLDLPAWYRPADLERYWGRDPKSAQEHAEPGRIRWALHAPWGPIGLDASWHGEPGQLSARVKLSAPDVDLSQDHIAWATTATRRVLGLHLDPAAFEASLRSGQHYRLVESNEGLTIPQTATVFDGAVWVICGQQVSLPVAFTIRRRLAENFGVPLPQLEAPRALYAPPRPQDLEGVQESQLGELGFSRRKSEYLLGLAQRVREGFDLEALRSKPASEVEETLQAIRGFGPWSVNYVMMRALGFQDQVPVGDAGLARALVSYYELDARPSPEKTRELMQPFAPHRSLATFHFWAKFA